jgi:hypothetical protein
MGATALPAGAGQGGADRLGQPAVPIRGDQRNAGQVAEESQPPGAVLGGGDVQAQDLPVPYPPGAGSDCARRAAPLPSDPASASPYRLPNHNHVRLIMPISCVRRRRHAELIVLLPSNMSPDTLPAIALAHVYGETAFTLAAELALHYRPASPRSPSISHPSALRSGGPAALGSGPSWPWPRWPTDSCRC